MKKSFRTITISASKGIKAVIGKLKTAPTGSTKVQKYLFKTSKWSMAQAKAWVKAHKKDFEILDIKKETKEPYEFRAICDITKSFTKENPPEGIPADIFNTYLGVFECVMSTSTKDYDKDIVAWSAIEKGAAQLNRGAVVLFNHNQRDPPIGTYLKAWGVPIEKNVYGIECGRIHAYVGISKTASTIWTLIEEKILKAMSVGGILKDAEEIYDEDDKLDYCIIKDWDLHEGSVVNIAANPECQITAILGKMLKDRKGGVSVTKDDNPEGAGDDELPEELDIWENIEEKLTEALNSHKEAILSEIEEKLEEVRSQNPSPEGYDEFKEATEQSIDSLNTAREQNISLFETLFAQQGYEVPKEPDEDNGEDNGNDDDKEE